MTILITGGTGFVGAATVDHLAAAGEEVVVLAATSAMETAAIAYVHLTGGDPAGEIDWLKLPVMDVAGRHLAELEKLLTAYASEMQAYLPRTRMEKEEDEGDYDHLSRFREWSLSGDSP